MSKYIIVVDTETTGLSPAKGCEITEIGALKVDESTLEVVDTFSSLIDIDGPVPWFITNLTGITREMLDEQGLPLPKVLEYFAQFCGDAPMYAHNAAFDKRFVRHSYESTGVPFEESDWIDTISIFKKAWPGRKTYKLESLILDHRLATKEDHRAVSDAQHTLELMRLAKGEK